MDSLHFQTKYQQNFLGDELSQNDNSKIYIQVKRAKNYQDVFEKDKQ